MDKAIAELSGKLKALSFRIKKTDELIDKAEKKHWKDNEHR